MIAGRKNISQTYPSVPSWNAVCPRNLILFKFSLYFQQNDDSQVCLRSKLLWEKQATFRPTIRPRWPWKIWLQKRKRDSSSLWKTKIPHWNFPNIYALSAKIRVRDVTVGRLSETENPQDQCFTAAPWQTCWHPVIFPALVTPMSLMLWINAFTLHTF